MLNAIGVALSGLKFNARKAQTASENIANAGVSSSPDGSRRAYQAQDTVAVGAAGGGVRAQTGPRDLATLRVPVEPIENFISARLPQATSRVGINANLPAGVAPGFTDTLTFEIVDSLGASVTVEAQFTKLPGTNQFRLDLGNARLASDPSIVAGAVSPASVDVTFDGSGRLQAVSTYPLNVTVSGLVTGSADVTFDLDLGTIGQANGLTQFASTTTPPEIDISAITQNGRPFGGITQSVATGSDFIDFPNVNFDEELITLAQSEQGYASNAQTIRVGKEMFDTLLDALNR